MKDKNMSELENNNDKIVVLHIAGTGRNGSTLMERVLNELPDFFAAGELNNTHLNKDQYCFCGKKFQECPVWRNIINNDYIIQINEKWFAETSRKYQRWTNFLNVVRKKLIYSEEFEQYLIQLAKFV